MSLDPRYRGSNLSVPAGSGVGGVVILQLTRRSTSLHARCADVSSELAWDAAAETDTVTRRSLIPQRHQRIDVHGPSEGGSQLATIAITTTSSDAAANDTAWIARTPNRTPRSNCAARRPARGRRTRQG